MKEEFYQKPDLTYSPNYQKGRELGSQAINPLSKLTEIGSLSDIDRKEFLAGFATELDKYILNNGIILPIGTMHLKSNIDFPPFLSGIAAGLSRTKLSDSNMDQFRGSDPNDPSVWEDTLSLIDRYSRAEGYMIGFLASLARDYGIISNGHETPNDKAQYEIYSKGSKAEPSNIVLMKSDESLGVCDSVECSKKIYRIGLKVWLCESSIDSSLVDRLMHPETLKTFKEVFLDGKDIVDIEGQSPEIQEGYKLAKKELEKRQQQ